MKKAAVLGSPIAHSRSPQLHLAAYRALDLSDWTYERIECGADELPGVVGGFGPEWVGVSVTMPGKFAALRFADERTDRAELVGSANTLLRTSRGWRADNTDIDGVLGALGTASGRAVVSGSGGTAPAAIVALAELGVGDITVVARNPDKAARLVELAARVGAAARFCELDSDPGGPVADAVSASGVLVSTLPADVAGRYAAGIRRRAGAAGRDLRPVADAAGRGGDRRGRAGDQRPADAAASGVRASRTIHRAAGAARGDDRRFGLACRAC